MEMQPDHTHALARVYLALPFLDRKAMMREIKRESPDLHDSLTQAMSEVLEKEPGLSERGDDHGL